MVGLLVFVAGFWYVCHWQMKMVSVNSSVVMVGYSDGAKSAAKSDAASSQPRMMKGVMRVGLLCKGLLLRGSLNLHLIVLCAEKPTQTLVRSIAELLPAQLAVSLLHVYNMYGTVGDFSSRYDQSFKLRFYTKDSSEH